MIAALHFLVILAIAVFYYRNSGIDNPFLYWSAFAFKIAMSIALGLVYLYYYTANDTWLFFQDATVLANYAERSLSDYLLFLFTDDPASAIWNELTNTQERSVFLIKAISIFSLISNHNYWVSAAYFGLLSFMAAWYLFRITSNLYPEAKLAGALAFLFFPSVIFWSSGLVKETLALAGLYFVSGVILKVVNRQTVRVHEVVLSLACFLVAWYLKYYWAALFGAVSFTTLIVFSLRDRVQFVSSYKQISWLIVFTFLCGIVSVLHPNFNLSQVLTVLVSNHNEFVRISEPDSIIHYYALGDSWWSVIINSPLALFSGLFRPFIWEATSAAALLAAFENVVIVILFISTLSNLKAPYTNKMLLLTVSAYVILLCIFLALSTPNFGTLSRYRVGFMPFLIYIIAFKNPLLIYLTNRIRLLR